MTICLLACAVSVDLSRRLCFTLLQAFEQHVGNGHITIDSGHASKLHPHECLQLDFFGVQEVSESLGAVEVFSALEEQFELFTDHCPNKYLAFTHVTALRLTDNPQSKLIGDSPSLFPRQSKAIHEDVEVVVKETESETNSSKEVIHRELED